MQVISYFFEKFLVPSKTCDFDVETPDPIPSSEAKPIRLMVILTGEPRRVGVKSGYRQDFMSLYDENHRGFPFAPMGI